MTRASSGYDLQHRLRAGRSRRATINLTRYNLFFPEKRPFFLENAGTFAVGTPQAVELFFSRRIGIGEEGRPVPIIGGARLTGRAAGVTVGFLDIQTERVRVAGQAVRRRTTSLARSSRVAHRSQIGAIAVALKPTAPGIQPDPRETGGSASGNG